MWGREPGPCILLWYLCEGAEDLPFKGEHHLVALHRGMSNSALQSILYHRQRHRVHRLRDRFHCTANPNDRLHRHLWVVSLGTPAAGRGTVLHLKGEENSQRISPHMKASDLAQDWIVAEKWRRQSSHRPVPRLCNDANRAIVNMATSASGIEPNSGTGVPWYSAIG